MSSFKRSGNPSYYEPSEAMEEVRGFIEKWQNILGLSEWEISAEIVHSSKIHGGMGHSSWNTMSEKAIIEISFDCVDEHHGCELEETVVHELLHVFFNRSYDLLVSRILAKNPEESIFEDLCAQFVEKAYENDIERLAKTFVTLQRVIELMAERSV